MNPLAIVVVLLLFAAFRVLTKRPESESPMQSEKKRGCCLFTLIKWFLICLGLLTVFVLFTGTPSESGSAPSSTVSSPAADPTQVPTAAPTSTPEPDPTTLDGWALKAAQSVYGGPQLSSSSLISVSCEQVDGETAPMITINVHYPSTFLRNGDDRMASFLYNAMRVCEKIELLAREGKIEYGSIFIHGKTTFVDNYGNESEGDAAQIRIKAAEAAKVNWDNFTGDMLPGVAVSFGIHTAIRDGLTPAYHSKIRK